MGKVTAGFTMSLDGFIAGPNDEVDRLFRWYYSGDTDFPVPGTNMVFKISHASAELLHDEWAALGALVTGRRGFDVSGAWGGQAILGVPTFIVTHRIPPEWDKEGSPFTFVTDGVETAVAKAKEAAGDKDVGVGGSKIVQQCIKAGLLDEIQIELAPILLGEGIRLFDALGTEPIDLEITSVVEGSGVTHLRYRVVRTTGPRKRDVSVTRVFDAPVELVWKAWTDPEYVKQWWGPTGFTCPLAEMDFRVGGVSLVCMRAPKEFGGQDLYNTWTYTVIVPRQRFEYLLHFTDKDGNAFDPAEMGLPAGIPKEVANVNTFKDLGNGKTELAITEYSYTTDQAHDLSKAGLEQCLDKMAAIFAKGK